MNIIISNVCLEVFKCWGGWYIDTVEPLHADTSLIRTPLYYGQFPMCRQNSNDKIPTFLLKKTSIIRTLSNTDNGHLISAPGGNFTQTFNLFITDTPGTMCQINIVGDVPFPVGNYTNIDQSAIKKTRACQNSYSYSHCSIVHSVWFGSGQFNFFFSGSSARDPYYFHL